MFAASKTDGVVAGGPPPSGDPYWSNVSLLTNFENNLTFRDESTNNFAITRNGVVNPSLRTPFSGGVGGSEYFNGSASYLSIPNNTNLQFGTGNFTIEFWYLRMGTNGQYARYFQMVDGDIVAGFNIFQNINTQNSITFTASSNGTSFDIFNQSVSITDLAWNHVALVRNGTNFTVYINGVGTSLATSSASIYYTGTGVSVIGGQSSPSRNLSGVMSNFRIVKGTAVYTANFTPPTAPLTAITNTSLLITGTGQGMFNNSTFVDQGPNALTVTATGAPVYSGRSPFGNTYPGSVLFNGSSQLSAGSNAAFALGTGNFTFECWINPSNWTNSAVPFFVVSGTGGFWVGKNTSNFVVRAFGVADQLTYGTLPTVGVWTHIVAVRSGTTLSMYYNGTRVATTTNSYNFAQAALAIGSDGDSIPSYYTGYISNARLIKGTAVYDPTLTTLTVPTAPLTAITNTSLLITGTGQGMFNNATFVDQGPNALTVTATGAPVYSGLSPYGNTYPGSVYFGGNGNYLSAPPAAATSFSGAFTMEAWINVSDAGRTIDALKAGTVISGALAGSTSGQWVIYLIISGGVLSTLGLEVSGVTILNVPSLTAALNTWHHVAMVRNGTTLTFYLNGTSVGSRTYGTTFSTNASGTVQIARHAYSSPNENWTKGYFSNTRVVNGTAVYTSNFTPPTTPLTAITNTSLLVRGDTGAFYDLSNNGLAETGVGAPVVTTQVKKFGSESGSFNGTNAYITTLANTALDIGSSDFTIEGWVYFNNTTGDACVCYRGAQAITLGSDLQWSIYRSGTSLIVRPYSGVTNYSINVGTVTTNTWYYFTLTRSGNTFRGFLNGTVSATTQTISGALNNNTTWLGVGIGKFTLSGVDYPLNGYIDDLRITKGVARYTANFTPPTATFPTGP